LLAGLVARRRQKTAREIAGGFYMSERQLGTSPAHSILDHHPHCHAYDIVLFLHCFLWI
jgi:hypothetical protein